MTGSITIHVTDRKGQRTTHSITAGGPLMFALRDEARLPVEGACGGSATCGTCHILVAPDWRARLPAKQDYEDAMLDMLNYQQPEASRLACQIITTAAMDGLELQLASEE